jgi:hypothetical protein
MNDTPSGDTRCLVTLVLQMPVTSATVQVHEMSIGQMVLDEKSRHHSPLPSLTLSQ